MNAERLHVITRAVRGELQQMSLVGRLSELVGHLQNMVNQPQQSGHQQNVTSVRDALYQELNSASSNNFSPAWCQMLEEIGGADLLGLRLRNRLQEIFERNQITPNVALEEIQKIFEAVQRFQGQSIQSLLPFSSFGSERKTCSLGNAN